MAPCTKVLLSECITIGLQKMRVMLLGVPKVVSWLVLVGVNECILIKVQMVRNSGKTNTFLILWSFFAGVSECIFSKVVSFWVGLLGILWPEVANNFAVPDIHVFLGPNLRVLWSKVMNNFAVPEI